MKITVGANPVTVTELGRLFVSGNSGTHVVKLVRASDQVDVPNGAASISMSGGVAAQFKYGALSSPVILAAGAAYYLVSQELQGGDQWHDLGSVTTTSVATCDSGAYFGSGYPWSVWGGPGQSYVPVDFKYGAAVPTVTIVASDATAAEPGSDTGELIISRSGSTGASLTVNYTVGGTATAGIDYASIGSSVTIPAGSSSATILLMPMDDTLAEGPETVVVSLAANAAYAIGAAATATVTIADDELSSSDPSLSLQLLPSAVSSVGNGNPVGTWTDSSGQGNNATQSGINRPTYLADVAATGKKGIYFDGVSSYMLLPNVANLNLTGNFTLTTWVYTDSGAVCLYIGGYDPAYPWRGYGLGNSINGVDHWACWTDTTVDWRDADTLLRHREWHHIAAVFSGSTVSFYYDGASSGSTTMFAPSSYSGNRAIGGDPVGNAKCNAFLRDVRIYSRALSGGEIAAIYQANAD
jgi:hypothetical protein